MLLPLFLLPFYFLTVTVYGSNVSFPMIFTDSLQIIFCLYFSCIQSSFSVYRYYDVTGLLHCYAIPAILEHRKRNKMAYSHHFISFSVFGVSISINCLFVRAQTQFILFDIYIIISCIVKNFQSSLNKIIDISSIIWIKQFFRFRLYTLNKFYFSLAFVTRGVHNSSV